jgi:hypothetical protein
MRGERASLCFVSFYTSVVEILSCIFFLSSQRLKHIFPAIPVYPGITRKPVLYAPVLLLVSCLTAEKRGHGGDMETQSGERNQETSAFNPMPRPIKAREPVSVSW